MILYDSILCFGKGDNKMLSVAICDDNCEVNNEIAYIVKEYARKNNIQVKISQFYDGKEIIDKHPFFDVLFLDIEMPKLNGIDAAKELRKFSTWGQIIYVTSYADYAKIAYAVHPFSYITKPFETVDIETVLTESIHYIQNRSPMKKFSVISESKVKNISVEDIFYFKTCDRKIKLVAKDNKWTFKGNLAELEQKLDSNSFGAPHKSYLVNFSHIECLKGYEIFMDNGEIIPISQKKAVSFKDKYYNYLENTFYLM